MYIEIYNSKFREYSAVIHALIWASVALALPSTTLADAKKPNFIVILTDDLGYGDFGCYGAEKIKTPNIDRMAKEGTKFESFYVSSVCSPTRASLMTGCYPKRVGINGVLFQRKEHRGLGLDEITLPELLKEQNYATALIGKWHLGFLSHQNPLHHGFDYWMGSISSNSTSYDPSDQEFDPSCVFLDGFTLETARNVEKVKSPLLRNNKMIEFPSDQTQLTKRYTKETLEFIKKNKDQPFFIYLAHNMPHIPLYASDQFKGKSEHGLYGDVIEELDWGVGEIMKGLKNMGLDDNTFVILTSDNGPNKKAGGMSGPLKGAKGSNYEGGVRVPCIMRWPGKVPAGVVNTQPIAVFDLLPTLVLLGGGVVPTDRIIDGRDVWPLIADGGKTPTPHEAIFFKSDGVRAGDWKLLYAEKIVEKSVKLTKEQRKLPDDERKTLVSQIKKERRGKPVLSLFNLKEDIGETTNVIDQYPEIAKKLQALMIDFEKDITLNAREADIPELEVKTQSSPKL